ncbi:hypothetical protein GLOIN_2v1707893 [Rhizophagus irregularis DAOM 181602=DAOM 197198]|uniref:Uncharacterized protein n=1 Tax=Rhizophagus irregularis (strain DAOM 181602 / DAOM 197198 / MUCL 43194) TaxID=747089 RepID=A0A2P4P6K0_RHIID|nr:hypothetical protein GLOIN_2v1707893 [Rhizophagus irregularis DAOM 181602=DAOM 197198]POG61001.1 hypothetical protein GLOIN_2v1707893 [Rhizophagus irregularis DAOM 181602=DAOM 197198]|eukprot:XP_025167867.1 hypothetical protein GLOIN_2v1707893 [Rhizophagus irregularis DAOM 181602=DAOM 197198]
MKKIYISHGKFFFAQFLISVVLLNLYLKVDRRSNLCMLYKISRFLFPVVVAFKPL